MNRKLSAIGTSLLATSLLFTGCGIATDTPDAPDVIDYWLWDSAQQPGYQQCADAFERESGIKVKITQYGWNDYWSKLTAGFIADRAPDVFTNHLGKYPQFAELGVLVPLDELDPTKGLQDDDFAYGLAELWKGPDGHPRSPPHDRPFHAPDQRAASHPGGRPRQHAAQPERRPWAVLYAQYRGSQGQLGQHRRG